MFNTKFKHSSAKGTYKIDCQVLGVKQGKYEIKYYDDILKKDVVKFVDSESLYFPKFADRIM